MTWFGWFLVFDLALNAVGMAARVGTSRTYTPKVIVSAFIEVTLLIVGILTVGVNT